MSGFHRVSSGFRRVSSGFHCGSSEFHGVSLGLDFIVADAVSRPQLHDSTIFNNLQCCYRAFPFTLRRFARLGPLQRLRRGDVRSFVSCTPHNRHKKERKRCSTPQVLHFNFLVRSIFSIPAKFKHFFIRLISPLHLTSPLGQIFLLQSISALRKIIPAKSVAALRKNVFAPNVPRPGIPVSTISTICPNMHLPNNRSTLLRPLICRVSLS